MQLQRTILLAKTGEDPNGSALRTVGLVLLSQYWLQYLQLCESNHNSTQAMLRRFRTGASGDLAWPEAPAHGRQPGTIIRGKLSLGLVTLVLCVAMCAWAFVRIHETRINAALIKSIHAYDEKRTLQLLASGADPNATEPKHGGLSLSDHIRGLVRRLRGQPPAAGEPALITAIEGTSHGPPEADASAAIAVALLQHGARIDVTDPGGRPPLEVLDDPWFNPTPAALAERQQLVKSGSFSPLCWMNARDPRLELALVRAGADVTRKFSCGDTEATSTRNHEVLRLLKSRHVLTFVTEYGEPLVIRAAWRGDAGYLRALLDLGADVNAHEPGGDTPLSKATYNLDAQMMRFLIHRGARVNEQPGMTNRAIIYAISKSSANALNLLLDAGASLQCRDEIGFTPVMHAIGWENTMMTRLLLSRGAKLSHADLSEVTRGLNGALPAGVLAALREYHQL